MRRAFLFVSALVVLASGACDRKPLVMSAANHALAQTMAGRWTVRFTLTTSPILNSDVRHLGTIDGQIALLGNTSVSGQYGGLPVVTDYGTYDIDFSPFGFDSPERGRPPQVIVGPIANDSVIVMLSPSSDDLSITMRGKSHADSIGGTWTVSFSRGGVGWGTFVMTRVQ